MSWNSLNLYVALRLTQSAGRRQPPAEIQDQGLRTRGRPTTPALAVVRECPACLFMATTNASRAAVTLMIVARVKCARHNEGNAVMVIKAIPIQYHGHLFRSRLEAKCAVVWPRPEFKPAACQ